MPTGSTVIAPLLAVREGAGSDAPQWYRRVLHARERFRIGESHLVALDVDGSALFIRESTGPDLVNPSVAGLRTAAFELLVDDPDQVIALALDAGAIAAGIEDHDRPWDKHRQGGFSDPWGHAWLVGDRSPLSVPIK